MKNKHTNVKLCWWESEWDNKCRHNNLRSIRDKVCSFVLSAKGTQWLERLTGLIITRYLSTFKGRPFWKMSCVPSINYVNGASWSVWHCSHELNECKLVQILKNGTSAKHSNTRKGAVNSPLYLLIPPSYISYGPVYFGSPGNHHNHYLLCPYAVTITTASGQVYFLFRLSHVSRPFSYLSLVMHPSHSAIYLLSCIQVI